MGARVGATEVHDHLRPPRSPRVEQRAPEVVVGGAQQTVAVGHVRGERHDDGRWYRDRQHHQRDDRSRDRPAAGSEPIDEQREDAAEHRQGEQPEALRAGPPPAGAVDAQIAPGDGGQIDIVTPQQQVTGGDERSGDQTEDHDGSRRRRHRPPRRRRSPAAHRW